MTYSEATDYLFSQLPAFERQGSSGYKPGLERTLALSALFGNPHKALSRVVHVAGTNGKGSTSHTLAAILQSHGNKVGLFTSPHLVDFRERIRINGSMISADDVVDFVERFRSMDADIEPSFFELTTIMAFEYFAREGVDYAIVEVGLGGRLDSTNIVDPSLCVITNISMDHTDLLGDTPSAIAAEKAGIIKPHVPVVIGEAEGDVRRVFEDTAKRLEAPVVFAHDVECEVVDSVVGHDAIEYRTRSFGNIRGELTGTYQVKNMATVLRCVDMLNRQGASLTADDVRCGVAQVTGLTGLAGRWMTLRRDPLVVCDTGHNPGGWNYIVEQLTALPGRRHIIIGFVADKDVMRILAMLAERCADARYYFTQPQSHRRLEADVLARMAYECGLRGEVCGSVSEAYENALADMGKGDSLFIGGSNYVVGELLGSHQ